jgi:hypothetical protein
VLETPWSMSTTADLAFPQTCGKRPEKFEEGQQFEAALLRAAVADPTVHRAMVEVGQLLHRTVGFMNRTSCDGSRRFRTRQPPERSGKRAVRPPPTRHRRSRVMPGESRSSFLTPRWSKPDSNSRSHPLTRSRRLGEAGASGSARQDRRRKIRTCKVANIKLLSRAVSQLEKAGYSRSTGRFFGDYLGHRHAADREGCNH